MHSILTFEVDSDLVVLGTDPEMADVSNPRGEIVGLAYCVRASNAHGDTWAKTVAVGRIGEETELYAKADKLAQALRARLANYGKLPVDAAQWQQGRPIYGSDAYVEYGQDDDVALERREAEEEMWV